MQAIKPADLSHSNDELFCPEASQFSGFESDHEAASPTLAAIPSATGSPSPLLFIADRDLQQAYDPVEFTKSETVWKDLECCAAQIGSPTAETEARMEAFGSSRLSRVPKLVQQMNLLPHAFAMPLHWNHAEKTSKLNSMFSAQSASKPMLSFFKTALRTATIVAARVFVGFDRIVLPALLDESNPSSSILPQEHSYSEGLAAVSMGAFKTSSKPLCEAGLLAPSEGLASMSSPIHAIGLRINHPDILVPFEKTSDPAVMTPCFHAIAHAVAGCIIEIQSDNFLSRTGIFFHEFMNQLEMPVLKPVPQVPVPAAPQLDIQSIVNEAVRQATAATATGGGPMRRRQKNAPKPAAIKLGFNLRGARTKFLSDENEGRIMYLRILRKNILCRRFAQPQNSSHGGARSGPEQEEIRRKGFEFEFEEAKAFSITIQQFVNFVATVDTQCVPAAFKHLINHAHPLHGFQDGVDAIQMDDAGASLTALDEELDGAHEGAGYADDYGIGYSGIGSGTAGYSGTDQASTDYGASPTTIDVANQLANFVETPEQIRWREDQEMMDFLMRSLTGTMNFSDEEVNKIRLQATRPGDQQRQMQNIAQQYDTSNV